MEENLPADADPSEWTWQALANWANSRFELNLKDKDLKKYARTDGDEFQFGHQDLEEFLNEKANDSLEKFDLSPAREFLLPDWGRRSLSAMGPPQVCHGRRSGELGRASIARRSFAAFRRCHATFTPRKKPSCPRGSP